MTLKEHKKHADVKKPLGGKFHRNEIALIGAPCGMIQELSRKIASQLPELRVGYVDASHSNSEEKGVFDTAYTDMINFHQVTLASDNMEYEWRAMFNSMDLVLVNGNHFKADKQLIIVNEAKKESLERKLDRLTHVVGAILDEGQDQLHDYLIIDYSDVQAHQLHDIEGISNLIKSQIRQAPVKGLVLAGGKSSRMGQDKGLINYHGVPQREYLASLLSDYCVETFISTNEGIDSSFGLINDSFKDLGPYGGILSAFREDPDAAWLVVATDIPLLDQKAISQLINQRNHSKIATCFHNPETNFPEPLITLWEPRAYQRLLYFLSLGYSCPRKVLINSEIAELNISNKEALLNANTPEEKDQIFGKING